MEINYEPLDFTDLSFPFIFHRGCAGEFLPHWHDSIEIHYVYQGVETLVVDSHQIPVESTDIVCISSEQIHWYKNQYSHKYHTLIVHPYLLKNLGFDPTDTLIPCFKDTYVTDLFNAIAQEDREKSPYYEASIKAKVISLLVYLYRNYRKNKNDKLTNYEPEIQTEIVVKILKYIKKNYSSELTIAKIGNAVGLSTSYLCSCFQKSTKTTINKYINNLRCCKARSMLLAGSTSVTQVALQCGFNNMSYFSKTYSNIIGELPSETLERSSNKTPPHNKL